MTCKWCGKPVVEEMRGECMRCWALRERIVKNPEIAGKMIASLRKAHGGPR